MLHGFGLTIDMPRTFCRSTVASNGLGYRIDGSVSVEYHVLANSNIILMIADGMACNPRNPRPATVFNNANEQINVYGDDVEVDYRGNEVTVENFVRVLTGRVLPGTPLSKQLLSDENSNILIYLTVNSTGGVRLYVVFRAVNMHRDGHGGDGFLKFQDAEEISSVELADAFGQMHEKRRYNEMFFIIDTCQAESMYLPIYSPNVIGLASSKVGEDSLSHHVDPAIGVYVIDRFTYYALEFLEKVKPTSKKTIEKLLKVCPYHECHSTVSYRTDLFHRDLKSTLVTDFFGSVRHVERLRHNFSASAPPSILPISKVEQCSKNQKKQSCLQRRDSQIEGYNLGDTAALIYESPLPVS